MAGRPGQPGAQPQYSLPKLTQEEQFVQKKQGEYIQSDVRMLNGMDVDRPFADVRDAVSRLMPFHLFNSVDASEADLDDTPDHAGANLMSNRQEAWQELCISKANDLRKRADNSAAQIAALEQQMDAEALAGTRPLDRFAMVKLQQEDLKRKIAAERALLSQLVVVPQQQAAVAAPAAAVVAAAAAANKGQQQAAAQIMVNPASLGIQGGMTLQQLQLQQAAALQRLPQAQQQQLIQQQQLLQLQQQQQYAFLLQQQHQQQLLQQQLLQQQQAKK